MTEPFFQDRTNTYNGGFTSLDGMLEKHTRELQAVERKLSELSVQADALRLEITKLETMRAVMNADEDAMVRFKMFWGGQS